MEERIRGWVLQPEIMIIGFPQPKISLHFDFLEEIINVYIYIIYIYTQYHIYIYTHIYIFPIDILIFIDSLSVMDFPKRRTTSQPNHRLSKSRDISDMDEMGVFCLE
jgi:hypothetical protein